MPQSKALGSSARGDTGSDLGRRLRAARRDQGLTLREVNERTGVSVPYLSDLERGVLSNPTLDKVTLIARALGVGVDELLGSAGEKDGAKDRRPSTLVELSETAQFRDAIERDAQRWKADPEALQRSWLETLERIAVDGRRPKSAMDYLFIFEAIRRAIDR